MNTLVRLDSFVFSYLSPARRPSRTGSTPSSPSSPSSSSPSTTLSNGHVKAPPSPSGSGGSPRPKRRKGRRPKRTTTNIKLPPPSTPLFLRILLALWSILLSFWQSLVGETRAVRDKRQKRAERLLRRLTGDRVTSPSIELEGGDSASEVEPSGSEDDEWIDPVTRAPESSSDGNETPSISFQLHKPDDNQDDTKTTTITNNVNDATPASILENPLPPSSNTRSRHARLLPNPMSTSLLDPSVPAVPASQTISLAKETINKPPRLHQTPFHLQKFLILDLDETLIHSTSRPLSYAASAGGGLLGLSFGGLFGTGKRREGHTVEVVLRGRSTTYHVYKRPYVDRFLKKVASWYTLVIFTASMPEYADPVIDWLDGGRGLFARRFYRDSCHLTPNGSYIKDLSLIEPDLSRVCFMDNSPTSYAWNRANALPVEGWTSDPYDEALLHSIPVLDSLRFVNDVRRVLGIRGFL